eukprot:scaffold8747_cov96-Cylindrotheca_fusiformis.AAC.12
MDNSWNIQLCLFGGSDGSDWFLLRFSSKGFKLIVHHVPSRCPILASSRLRENEKRTWIFLL